MFLVGSFIFLYLQTFVLPHTPIYQGDTAPIFLLDGMRMLEGQVIYRDFFELTYPGAPLVYAVLFKILGIRSWIPNEVLIVLGLGLSWLGVSVSRRVMSGASAFLPSVLFLALAFGTALDANHHWFTTLAIMGALAVLIEERTLPRLATAGTLCGLATCFTQSRGLVSVLGFALFLVWEFCVKRQGWRWLIKAESCLLAGTLAIAVPFAAYFAWKAGVQQFFLCTFSFVRSHYLDYRWNKPSAYMTEPPGFPSWLQFPSLGLWLSVHVLIPLIFFLFLARYWARKNSQPQEPWDRLMLINISGLFLFLGIAFSPVWERLCQVALPAFILFVWFINSLKKHRQATLGFLWSVALVAMFVQPVMTQTGFQGYLDAPTGRIAFGGSTEPGAYPKFQWLLKRTHPLDFFYNARDADMYFLLRLRNPAPVHFLTTSDYTRPEHVEQVIEGLERARVRMVLWWPELDLLEDENHPAGDHLGPLRVYLRGHYRVVKTFDDGAQIWERKR
jgi:hypothetical protein